MESNAQSPSLAISLNVIDNSDPVMRDCYALRQRLLETEKSLQSLTIQSKISVNASRNSTSSGGGIIDTKESNYLSDNPPVLTLADLTPTTSQRDDFESNITELQSQDLYPLHSSLNLEETLQKKSSQTSGDAQRLRKKLTKLQEENTTLFLQNNKLLNELEKMSFQLQECRSQLKEMNALIEENQQLKGSEIGEKIKLLKEQVENKNYAIRELEELVLELRNHLINQEDIDEEENRRLREKMDESLRTIAELSEIKLQNLNEKLHETKKNDEQKIKELENDNRFLREENGNLKSDNMNLQELLSTLRTEIMTLQNNSSEADCLRTENKDLKQILGDQQTKLGDYECELSKTKDHMRQLETLIQKIQEERLLLSKTDSGMDIIANMDRREKIESCSGEMDGSSQRALVADLQLKLAMKDTELHKLQVLVASNALNQQKLQSEYSYEGISLHDLRSELCSVVQKTRISDKKQMKLEQKITQLEEDISGKKCQLVEMNERISDKVALINTLENKLLQRNRKLMELHQEKEAYSDKCDKFQKENSTMSLKVKEQENSISEKDSRIHELEEMLSNSRKSISQMENSIQTHEVNTKALDIQSKNVKKLHAEHCKELEHQIENLQHQISNKSSHIAATEAKLIELLNGEKLKDASISEMKEYTEKMEQLLEEKENVIKKYQENLESLKDESRTKNKQLADLKASVEHYKGELDRAMKQLQGSRIELSSVMNTKSYQIESLLSTNKHLRDDIEERVDRIKDLEASSNENIDMLEQSQKHICEMEELVSRYEEEISTLKQSIEVERSENGKLQNEHAMLSRKVDDSNTQLSAYKDMMKNLIEELTDINSNNLVTTSKVKESGLKLLSQSDIIKDKLDEIRKMSSITAEIKITLSEKDEEIRRLKENIGSKDIDIDFSLKAQRELSLQLQATENQLKESTDKILKLEKEMMLKHKIQKNEVIKKLERLLAISQDDASMKDAELKEFKECRKKMESLLNDQQWQLKQKAAQFTQLDIAMKNEKSELEQKAKFLADEIEELKCEVSKKDTLLLDMEKSCQTAMLQKEEKDKQCDAYEKKFKQQEESNLRTIEDVKQLNQEMERCKIELRNRVAMEEEINNLRNETKNMLADLHTLKNQLMNSQQTVLELNKELNEINEMLKSKEADCTRLARELGASQLREAQQNAHLNEEMRKIVLNEELKSSQKSEEIESIRNQLNNVLTSSQQTIMKLQVNLQRSEDEKELCKNDMERYKVWIKELSEDNKSAMEQLQLEQHKCKSAAERITLLEAKVVRYSACLSIYKRSTSAPQQSKPSPRSASKELIMELDSTCDSEGNPGKDSFDNLLKATEEELNDGRSMNSSTSTAFDVSPAENLFGISSFDDS